MEVFDVIGRQRQAIREEEVLKVGALCRADPVNRGETANEGLDERRTASEVGDGEEVD